MWLSTMWGQRVIVRGEYGEHGRGKVWPNHKEHHTVASYSRMTDRIRGR